MMKMAHVKKNKINSIWAYLIEHLTERFSSKLNEKAPIFQPPLALGELKKRVVVSILRAPCF